MFSSSLNHCPPMLLVLFIVNVISALVGFLNQRLLPVSLAAEVMHRATRALSQCQAPWIIVGTWTWMVVA